MALTGQPASGPRPPPIGLPSPLWVGIGLFGLAGGGLLLLFTDPALERLVWLGENYRTGSPAVSAEKLDSLERGGRVWGWSGVIMGAATLPLWHSRARASLAAGLSRAAGRVFRPLPMPADRHGGSFFTALLAVLAFTALVHWSLTEYKDVDWFGGEDGVSEWWSVATFLAAAALAGATGWRLRGTGHPRLALFHLVFGGVMLVGAMEEISWGQRLFDWGTPSLLGRVNEQGETTVHNVKAGDAAVFAILFWGSAAALAGAAIRAAWHGSGRVTTADFLLPSLVLAPALLMILVWRIGDTWAPASLARLLMESFDAGPQGSEVPEVLLGLCLCLYTYGNLKRANTLRSLRGARGNTSVVASPDGRDPLQPADPGSHRAPHAA